MRMLASRTSEPYSTSNLTQRKVKQFESSGKSQNTTQASCELGSFLVLYPSRVLPVHDMYPSHRFMYAHSPARSTLRIKRIGVPRPPPQAGDNFQNVLLVHAAEDLAGANDENVRDEAWTGSGGKRGYIRAARVVPRDHDMSRHTDKRSNEDCSM